METDRSLVLLITSREGANAVTTAMVRAGATAVLPLPKRGVPDGRLPELRTELQRHTGLTITQARAPEPAA